MRIPFRWSLGCRRPLLFQYNRIVIRLTLPVEHQIVFTDMNIFIVLNYFHCTIKSFPLFPAPLLVPFCGLNSLETFLNLVVIMSEHLSQEVFLFLSSTVQFYNTLPCEKLGVISIAVTILDTGKARRYMDRYESNN